MQPSDEIRQYSKTVCEQIRWGKARHDISMEIENHLYDQRDAYIAQGYDENTAIQKAILQMGDAVFVGAELDKTHKPKPQWTMIFLTALLMAIGLFSNHLINDIGYAENSLSLIPYVIAFIVFLACYFLDFSIMGKYAMHFYFTVLAFATVGFLLSDQINGGPFLSVGGLSVGLAYFSLIFPLAYTLLVYSLRHGGYKSVVLCGLGYIPYAIILLLIPSLASFALFTVLALVLLYLSVAKGWFGVDKRKALLLLLAPTFAIVTAVILKVIKTPYLLNRFSILINPRIDGNGIGYIPSLVRDLLANSQLWGKGIAPLQYGNSPPALPASNTDFVLTTLTYNFGWIVFIGITAVIATFAVIGLYYTGKQKSILGTLVSLSVILSFVMQAAVYILSNLGFGVLPSLSLPLVSYGNTALIINSALIGFMLSVFRSGDVVRDATKPSTVCRL